MKTISEEHKNNIKKGMLAYFDKKGRTGTITKDGYKVFSINGKREYEHRLVWASHFGEIPKGYQVHHINKNKLDNRIENLKLISNSEHQKEHSKLNNLGQDRIGIEPINKVSIEIRKQIVELRKSGMFLKDICEELNLSYPTVSKYAKGVLL